MVPVKCLRKATILTHMSHNGGESLGWIEQKTVENLTPIVFAYLAAVMCPS